MTAAINKFATGLVDVNGNVTIPFIENPGQGIQWVVNVNVMNSPSAAIWTLTVGFQQVGNWTGSAPFGPVKAINQDTITITGTGMQPGLVINAQITGWADYDDGSIIIPNNVPTTAIAVETVVKVIDKKVLTAVAGNASITFHPPINTRRCTLCFSLSGLVGTEQFTLIGNVTGAFYYVSAITQPISKWNSLLEPLLDPTYTLSFSGLGVGVTVTIWVLASQTNAIVEQDSTFLVSAGSTPLSMTPIPKGNPINGYTSAVVAANGTTLLVGAVALPQSLWLNTLYLYIFGTASAACIGHTSGKYLLACPASNAVSLNFNGLQLNEQIDLVVGSWAAGATIIAGSTYGIA